MRMRIELEQIVYIFPIRIPVNWDASGLEHFVPQLCCFVLKYFEARAYDKQNSIYSCEILYFSTKKKTTNWKYEVSLELIKSEW